MSHKKVYQVNSCLICDDDKGMTELVADQLAQTCAHLIKVYSAQEALNVLELEDFDVLVTDIRLPDLDGISLIEKASVANPYMVSLIITGYSEAESLHQAIKVGAFDYIEKPMDATLLRNRVKHAVDIARSRRLEYRALELLLQYLGSEKSSELVKLSSDDRRKAFEQALSIMRMRLERHVG